MGVNGILHHHGTSDSDQRSKESLMSEIVERMKHFTFFRGRPYSLSLSLPLNPVNTRKCCEFLGLKQKGLSGSVSPLTEIDRTVFEGSNIFVMVLRHRRHPGTFRPSQLVESGSRALCK